MSNWGGARKGAGRPKQQLERLNKTVRVSKEEWDVIKPVVNLIKKDVNIGRALLKKFNKEDITMKKDCEYINLTSKDITLFGNNHTTVTLPQSGTYARCEQADRKIDEACIGGCIVPISRRETIKTTGLPEPRENVFYIVEYEVALQNPERDDLMIATGKIRNDKKEIVGYNSLNIL